jgi:adenine-specific DNA-methyltransferase
LRRTNLAEVREIDEVRREATGKLDPKRRGALGQFMTPSAIANFMASMFKKWPDRVDLLDPGAGIGSLTQAFARKFSERAGSGRGLSVRTYEIEPVLVGYLSEQLEALREAGAHAELIERDFIREGAFALSFGGGLYSHAILNPPYKKIGASSEYRLLLRRFGVETVNLYTTFLALAVALTKEGGEIVAIIPRSFCNGMYFRPFREWLLKNVAIRHIHVFESRTKAFQEDEVLQENIIIHFERGAAQERVMISTSHDATFGDYVERLMAFEEIVRPNDAESYIHIPTTELEGGDALFTHTLEDLALSVSTGPVVDFRVRDNWLSKPQKKSAPLLYAHHFAKGEFRWPREHKKPNAVRVNADTKKWLMPAGWYTITKRFSSKEERRRLVAYVVDPKTLPFEYYGFENHLNVLHWKKRGISDDMAQGLALFLNATVTDQHFRNFSGHTQVNATDLRTMRFPSKKILMQFGKWAGKHPGASQPQIDSFIESFYGK